MHLIKEVAKADVFLEANISLKTAIVGLIFKRKWVVSHHLPYTHQSTWQGKLKNRLTKFSFNISVSEYIKSTLLGSSVVIPNFFSPSFRVLDNVQRANAIIFVGRLVSDKGISDLILALKQIRTVFPNVTCSVVGNGPERKSIEGLIDETRQQDKIKLMGPVVGENLVRLMNEHTIMVIPSRWPEPFGIVALEGLACGCVIVCSSDGGLREASGGFGIYFKNGDVTDLANGLRRALELKSDKHSELEVKSFLRNHTVDAIADRYIETFLGLQ
jgi:glycosyltransferase involved in cell wall biosynthesis